MRPAGASAAQLRPARQDLRDRGQDRGHPGRAGGTGAWGQGTWRAGEEEGQRDENTQGWEHKGTELVNMLRGWPKCGTASRRGHLSLGRDAQGTGGWVQGLCQDVRWGTSRYTGVPRRGHSASWAGRGAPGMGVTSRGIHLGGEAQEVSDTVACLGGDTQGTRVADKASRRETCRGKWAQNAITPGGKVAGGAASPGGNMQGKGWNGDTSQRGHPGDRLGRDEDTTEWEMEDWYVA